MTTPSYIPRHVTYAIALYSGFFSLSFELVWARVFGAQNASASFSFPMCLAMFLLGLAIGAKWSRGYCSRHPIPGAVHVQTLTRLLAASGLLGWLSLPLIGHVHALSDSLGTLFSLYTICSCAAVFGAVFPLLTHVSFASDNATGAKLSHLYMINILGSVAGSAVTGFVFFEYVTLSIVVTALAAMSAVAALAVAWAAGGGPSRRLVGVLGVGVVALVALRSPAYHDLYANLHQLEHAPKYVLESRSGVIVVTHDDYVYSNGTYDGVFSVDLVQDANGILRPFSISAFHPRPRKMLCIGLASGSWASVLLAHPDLEELVIVEIEHNYETLLELIDPENPLLTDPRVRIVTDDARRWMLTTDERFDVIVSNTTLHWRAMASALLSVEFLELIKEHLAPGGVVLVNSTGSRNALSTALDTFEHVVSVSNTYFASDAPMDIDVARLKRTLIAYTIDGEPTLDLDDPAHQRALDGMLWHFEHPEDRCSYVRGRARIDAIVDGAEPITDANMGNEWDATSVNHMFDEPRAEPTVWHLDLALECEE